MAGSFMFGVAGFKPEYSAVGWMFGKYGEFLAVYEWGMCE
jgi:hypothetical protein